MNQNALELPIHQNQSYSHQGGYQYGMNNPTKPQSQNESQGVGGYQNWQGNAGNPGFAPLQDKNTERGYGYRMHGNPDAQED